MIGSLSRRSGRGGGTSLPGQGAAAPGARRHRAARGAPGRRRRAGVGHQRQDDHARRWSPAALGARARAVPQRRRREPPLRRRQRAADGAGRRAARACSRSTSSRCPRSLAARGRARCCSRTCSATSSTATASWSWWPSAGARMVGGLPPETLLVLGRRRPGRSARSATAARTCIRVRPRRSGGGARRRSRTPPTPRTACAAAPPTPTRRSTSATSATTAARNCGHARPPLDVAVTSIGAARPRRQRPSRSAARRPRARPLPGIYNVYNAARRVRPGDGARRRPGRWRPSASAAPAPRSAASSGSSSATATPCCCWSRTRPAPTRRCARWRRTCDERRAAAGAERPHRRRPRRVLDLGRRLRDGPPRAPATSCAAAPAPPTWRCAPSTPASTRRPHRDRRRTARAALDRALERAGPGGTAYVLPTYTAMLELQRVAAERGLVRPYWEATAR